MLVWTLDDVRAVGLVRRDLPSTYNLPWFLVMVKQLVNMSACLYKTKLFLHRRRHGLQSEIRKMRDVAD